MKSKTDTSRRSQIRNDSELEESLFPIEKKPQNSFKPDQSAKERVEKILSENLTTLQKVHAILVNCLNLTKKQKLEFAESERHFMKLYLKKLSEKLDK
ncbi:MAG: hypothetical protein ACXAB2_12010 [Candidatus Hodarchaeales archaeon]|jgi:hypothetical protein